MGSNERKEKKSRAVATFVKSAERNVGRNNDTGFSKGRRQRHGGNAKEKICETKNSP